MSGSAATEVGTMGMAGAAKVNPLCSVGVSFDMDVWDTLDDKLGQMGNLQGKLHVARTVSMDLWMRWCVRRASVAMLKEGLVYDRYAGWAKNPREFCHSMHREAYLIADEAFEARVASLEEGRPMHFGYFGRFVGGGFVFTNYGQNCHQTNSRERCCVASFVLVSTAA